MQKESFSFVLIGGKGPPKTKREKGEKVLRKISLCKMLTNEGKAADKPGEAKTGELEAGDE